jgi:hypothetical protein
MHLCLWARVGPPRFCIRLTAVVGDDKLCRTWRAADSSPNIAWTFLLPSVVVGQIYAVKAGWEE